MDKKIYYKTYQDRDNIQNLSYVQTEEDMLKCIKIHFNDCPYELAPVFEPVEMTEEEFNALPEFRGF